VSDRKTLFADVLLPVPIHQVFTYRIPFELNNSIKFGVRVIVPFGKNKLQTGIITRIHEEYHYAVHDGPYSCVMRGYCVVLDLVRGSICGIINIFISNLRKLLNIYIINYVFFYIVIIISLCF
jgi:hypothetical protein